MTRNPVTQLHGWIVEKPTRILGVAILTLIMFTLGLDLVFWRPGRLKEAALVRAQMAIDALETELVSVEEQYKKDAPWYRSGASYVEGLPETLVQVRGCLKGSANCALDLLTVAKQRSYRKALPIITQAQEKIEQGREGLAGVKKKLQENMQLRGEVSELLLSLHKRDREVNDIVQMVTPRLQKEGPRYLSRYTRELEEVLLGITKERSSVAKALGKAEEVMPPVTDTRGIGDPKVAMTFLQPVVPVLSGTINQALRVDTRLKFLAQAEIEATGACEQAKGQYLKSQQDIESVHQRTGYFLRRSFDMLEGAKTLRDAAHMAISTPVEGVMVDKPTAFETAKASIARSREAVVEANEEVSRAQKAKAQIVLVWKTIEAVPTYFGAAQQADSTLRRYHDAATWQDLKESNLEISNKVANARRAAEKASSYLDLSVQRFSDAVQLADEALASLKAAEVLGQSLIARSNQLEAFRSQYVSAYQRAQREVNNQSSDISSYGSYDSSATNDYQEATRSLASAKAHFDAKRYELAVQQARRAYSLAEGVGDKAQAAYQAAQERKRRLDDSFGDSNFSSGSSGSSSSGSWSSGSGTGRSSGSGSRSGSDSSFSGGSDSDF